MALNLVLVPQRQSAKGMALAWGEMEGVQSFHVFVAQKRLSPEELEAAQLKGGTDECLVAKVGPEVKSVVDDVTPQGEPRFYGVAMVFPDGAVKPARFRALPDGATGESFALSTVKAGAARPRPGATARPGGAAPAGNAGPKAGGEEDPLEARKRAQREARMRAIAGAPPTEPPAAAAPPAAPPPPARAATPPVRAAPPPAEAPSRAAESTRAAAPAPVSAGPPAEDPLEARKRQQAAARAAREGGEPPAPASSEAPPPPSSIPLEEELEVRMSGAGQTWDGLRIHWERDPRAAAYEVIASDHQIFGEELKDALAGRADFTTAVAVAPSVSAVIDNVTAREARGWYAVLVRYRDGKRKPHPFQVGDAATSGKAVAPFLNSNRTSEVRAEAEGMVEEAREQWRRWRSEQDGGARREAKRLVQDALLVFPGLPSAKALADEMG